MILPETTGSLYTHLTHPSALNTVATVFQDTAASQQYPDAYRVRLEGLGFCCVYSWLQEQHSNTAENSHSLKRLYRREGLC